MAITYIPLLYVPNRQQQPEFMEMVSVMPFIQHQKNRSRSELFASISIANARGLRNVQASFQVTAQLVRTRLIAWQLQMQISQFESHE